MKIELQDFDQPLKTHDVDFSQVTKMKDCGDDGVEIAYYASKNDSPITVKVRGSADDIVKRLENINYTSRLPTKKNKAIYYKLDHIVTSGNGTGDKQTIIYDTLSAVKDELEKGMFFYKYPHLGINNLLRVINFESLQNVGDGFTIETEVVTTKICIINIKFKVTLIKNERFKD